MSAGNIPVLPAGLSGAALVLSLNDRIRKINIALGSAAAAGPSPSPSGGGSITYGTHSARLSAGMSPGDGALWIETDRNNLVYELQLGHWVYLAGVYQRTQAQLAALAATLGTYDTGLLVYVTDYLHTLEWSGTAFNWAPGEQGSGMLVAFAFAPGVGTGWHACDGSSGVKYLSPTGSTGTVDLPDTTTGAAYMKLGNSYSDTITGAAVPAVGAIGSTGSGPVDVGSGAAVGAAETHTHPSPTLTLLGDPIANFEAILCFRI